MSLFRLELQEVKDDIGKNLDDMKTNQQQFISNVSEVIQENKMKHSNLSNEVSVLLTFDCFILKLIYILFNIFYEKKYSNTFKCVGMYCIYIIK